MKNLKNDNRLVAPLLVVALVISGVAVMRVTKAATEKPRSAVQAAPTTAGNLPEQTKRAGLDLQRINRLPHNRTDPFWHRAFLKDAEKAEVVTGIPMTTLPAPTNGRKELPLAGGVRPLPITGPVGPLEAQLVPAPKQEEPLANGFVLAAVMNGERPLAVIKDSAGEAHFVRVGEFLPPDTNGRRAKLTAIGPDNITISDLGRTATLRLGDAPTAEETDKVKP